MQLAVERRLQMSDLAQKCGGHHLFAAAAAATVDEYVKWATEELKRDDGGFSKVRGLFDELSRNFSRATGACHQDLK